MVELGERLKTLRIEHGFTQEELAEKIDTTRQAVSRWERSVTLPNGNDLKKMAEIYNVSIDEIVNQEEKKKGRDKQGIEQSTKDMIVFILLCSFMLIVSTIPVFGVVISLYIFVKYRGKHKRILRIFSMICLFLSICNLYLIWDLIYGNNGFGTIEKL